MRISHTAIVPIVAALFLVAAVAVVIVVVYRQPIAQNVSMRLALRDASASFHARRLNVLVVGEQDDEGTTDTIILAHLDLDRRTATLMSIPRDTRVALPQKGHMKSTACTLWAAPARRRAR